MYLFKTFLTVGKLKKILADMSDDAIVSARDRDCISLNRVHVINHPTISPIPKTGKELFTAGNINYENFQKYIYYQEDPKFGVFSVPKISDVYGGDQTELNNKSKQAIIFCDCG